MRVMQLTRGDAGAASTYLCQASKRATVPVAMGALQSFWEIASPAERQPLDAEAGGACRVQRRAHRFLAEASLHHFVETANVQLGIAPSTSDTVAAAQRRAALQPNPAARLLPPGTRCKSQRQWIRRWRRRWGIKLAHIGVRDEEPLEVTQRKVCLVPNLCIPFEL